MDEQSFWLVVNVELLIPLAILDDEGMTSEDYTRRMNLLIDYWFLFDKLTIFISTKVAVNRQIQVCWHKKE